MDRTFEKKLEELVLKSEHIKLLTETEGWRLLVTLLNDEIERLKEKLVVCPIEELEKTRIQITCFNRFFNIINLTLQSGKVAKEELEDL